jgi:hypothetical protein
VCSSLCTTALPCRQLVVRGNDARITYTCSGRRSPSRSSPLMRGTLSGRRSREGQVSVGSLRVLPSVAGAPAPEVPRPDGTDRWRHAVGAQRGGVARSRCGDGRRVARRPRLPERRGEVELAARAPMITGGGLEALRATGETSPWRVIAALVTRGLAGRTDARGRGD